MQFHLNALFLYTVILSVLSGFTFGQPTCQTTSHLDDLCFSDDDCVDTLTVCRRVNSTSKTCSCHENAYRDSESKGCILAPDKIGDSCDGNCKPPMTCRSGTCQCLNADSDKKACFSKAKYAVVCSKDADCVQPFTSCQDNKCKCVQGTRESRGKCIYSKTCPDGARPKGTCRVEVIGDRDLLANIESSNHLDNCGRGEYCVTDGSSSSGYCCEQVCPLGTKPETKYSCSTDCGSKCCPSETHYCHKLVGPGFATSSCCLKPCQEPKSVYIDGKCYAPASLFTPCIRDEQCDGGLTMYCDCDDRDEGYGKTKDCEYEGECICNDGFRSSREDRKSRLSCVKECDTANSIDDRCFGQSKLGGRCYMEWQCPNGTTCHLGICHCKCGYQPKGDYCTDCKEENGESKGILGGLLGDLFGGGGDKGACGEKSSSASEEKGTPRTRAKGKRGKSGRTKGKTSSSDTENPAAGLLESLGSLFGGFGGGN